MKLKKNKRRRNLSVLLIPDDNADPISFRVSFNLIKILVLLTVIIIVHLVSGFVFYYKYAIVHKKNVELNKENVQLKEDNKKMYSLSEVVDDFLKYQDRVRAALGIDKGLIVSNRKSIELLNNITPTIDMISEKTYAADENQPGSQLDFFLTSTRSSYHNFQPNIPTKLPVEGYLTTTFQDLDWFLPNRHLGIDIAATAGTVVKAAGDGVILFSNWTNDLGYLIIIDHLNGFLTYYGHNQILFKKERSTVKKGDKIALVGNSGKSTAPHLHFEIWKDGVPVNPSEYLLSFQNSK